MPDFLEPVIWHHDYVRFSLPDDMGGVHDSSLWQHWIEQFQTAEPDALAALCALYGGRVIESPELVRALYVGEVFLETPEGLHSAYDHVWEADAPNAPLVDLAACGRCECDVCRALRSRLPPSIDLPPTALGHAALAGRVIRDELATLSSAAMHELAPLRDVDWHRDPGGPGSLVVLRDALLERDVTVSTLDLIGLVKRASER